MAYEMMIIEGNLGRDPELRYTQEGKAVATISVAVNKKQGDQKVTHWYSVSLWNGTAESVCKYLKKGSRVLVQGSNVRLNKYETKDGKPEAIIELTADKVVFLDSPEEGAGNGKDKDEADIPF